MEIDYFKKQIHFIGAGGISMSALIKLSRKLGAEVSGSDLNAGKYIDALNAAGARVYAGSDPGKVKGADLVVYSLAVPSDDPELSAARELDIPTVTRAQYLGAVSRLFGKTVAVAGTHGKTTATSLIATVMKCAHKSFTAHVGGEVKELNGNLWFGGFDYFVTEACEYKRSLLELSPDYAVILNVENDHPDCYKTTSELYDTFNNFLHNTLSRGGVAALNGDCGYYKTLAAGKRMHDSAYDNILTFGFEHTNNCYPVNITEKNGLYSFDVILNNCTYGHIDSTLYGHHNIYNLLCSVLVASHIGIDEYDVLTALNNFQGVARRFEKLGEINGSEIILDYAHHPSEITAAIRSAQEMSDKKTVVYFQPHTYSRTEKYFDAFVESLYAADELHLVKTYPARETPDMGKTSEDLYLALKDKKNCRYYFNLKEAEKSLLQAESGCRILLLGAGDFVPDIDKILR